MTDYQNNQQSEPRLGEGKLYSVSLGLGLPLDDGISCGTGETRVVNRSLSDIVLGSSSQSTR